MLGTMTEPVTSAGYDVELEALRQTRHLNHDDRHLCDLMLKPAQSQLFLHMSYIKKFF